MKTQTNSPRWLSGAIPLLACVLSAGAITFTNDTLIGVGDTNSDGQDIVITNCTVTVEGVHAFSSVRILNRGVLTHSSDTNVLRLILTITNNFEIEHGGAVDVSGKGYPGGVGLGAGASRSVTLPYLHTAGAGGGYGGFGGSSSTLAPGGISYGTIPTPAEKGSGGGAGVGAGGPGGGTITIVAWGLLRLDGQILANGSDGVHPSSGGGAGGSVWLSATNLTGTGSISANGGAGEPNDGGGGGGGRIAVYVSGSISGNTSGFSGSLSAHGGRGATSGGAGTIYFRGSSDAVAQLLVDNAGNQGTNTPLSSFDLSDVTISGGAFVQSVNGLIRNLAIHSNSWVIQIPSQSIELKIGGSAVIDSDAGIMADGTGFPGGQGPGHGGGSFSVPFGMTWGGGGYGGYGGSSLSNSPGGVAYGSTTEPADLGSGGGGRDTQGGAGGGLVRLRVQGRLDVQGRISVNGADAIGAGSGGGSGGSLVISAGILSGTGLISANGGAGESKYGGGGGGGRMQLQLGTNLFGGLISARGGPGAHYGGAGTIYISEQRNPFVQVLVENGGMLSTNTLVTAISGSLDLELRAGALVNLNNLQNIHHLLIQSNSWLVAVPGTLQRLLTVNGNANIAPQGGILLDGKGYPAGQGSGAPTRSLNAGGGGGYGGYGGSAAFGSLGGNAYGSISAPELPGSGGGASFENGIGGAGSGGGNLQLRVSGALVLDGLISANGAAGGPGGGGGSGGSLWLTVGTLSGVGAISANGGSGDDDFGGGGGGGRIAITYATNHFTGSIVAQGGAGAVYGGAGTVYLTPARGGTAQIVVDNGGSAGANTLLSSQGVPSGSDLTVRGGATAGVGPVSALNVRQLLISSNAWLTQTSNNQQPSTLQLTLTGASRIETGGGINLDAKGSYFGLGAGKFVLTQALGYSGGGGGHGGYGGASIANAAGGPTYGSATLPTEPGSGGGVENPALYGAPGGGALRLFSTNTLVLDGRISANGAAATITGGGGGSGGGISIDVATLSGSGLISADGGDGDLAQGGGGGGGRIAVNSSSQSNSDGIALFSGTIQAYGGAGFLNGGAGTIYVATHGPGSGNLRIDNGGLAGALTPLPALEHGTELELVGGAVASAPSNSTPWNGVIVGSGATLIQSSTATNLELMVLGNLSIGTNSAISASGKGYSGVNGGPGAGSMSSNANASGSGGGYGGTGGASASGSPGGTIYGSASQPTDRGSRGGLYPTLTNFCQGGGAVRLQVTGTLTLDGKISADGNDALVESAGGGAGGSIWITTRKLNGAGIISADGGTGDPLEGGGGGGGRIALYSGTNFFTGTVNALGGGGANHGNDGTVVISDLPALRIVAQNPSDIISRAVDSVDLVFSSALSLNSVSNKSIILETPEGVVSGPDLSLLQLSPTEFQLSFPQQNTLGYYQIQLPPGLEDIFGAAMSQMQQGSFVIVPPVISGRVVDTNNLPVAYVTLSTGGGFVPTLTDTNGAYSLEVLPSWTGTVTPAKENWVFVPRSRSYKNLGTNATTQDFVMIAPGVQAVTQVRAGSSLTLQWFGINGVTYQAMTSTNLVDWSPGQPACLGSNQLMTLKLPLGIEPAKFLRLDTTY